MTAPAARSFSRSTLAALPHKRPPGRRRDRLTTLLVISFMAVLAAGSLTFASPGQDALGATRVPRAVIIVGPSSESTAEFLAEGRLFADQAERAGMRVTRIFHPRATWERVRPALQGANLVVYFGHGNGWPSPYAPFQEVTKNGFALNEFEGASPFQRKYYGGDLIRNKVRLARNAVVIIYRACYAAGNGEDWHPIPSKRVAFKRVDNFAAAFLHRDVRAGVVMAFRTKQWVNLAAALMRPGQTMNDIFRIPSAKPGWRMSGWMGRQNLYQRSKRTPGAVMHLDKHPTGGYSRVITGDLRMTTREWKGR